MSKKVGIALLLVTGLLMLSLGSVAAKPVPPAPEIKKGVFVDYGYSSPPWYPPKDETDSYRWGPPIHWAETDLPVDCTVYTKDAPGGAFAAVSPAFTEWDGYTPASLYSTPSENTDDPLGPPVLDGENTMSWGTIDGPGGIIGVCHYWYWVNTKEMVEFDIVFDIDETWSTTEDSNAFDVQNIATHELGHTLVLQDLRSPRDGALTMHAYTWLGDTWKGTLGSGDILGVQAIYGE